MEDGTPSPTAMLVSRTEREQQATVTFRAKFGITDPELSHDAYSLLFYDAPEEVTRGRSQEWFDEKEVHLQGCLD